MSHLKTIAKAIKGVNKHHGTRLFENVQVNQADDLEEFARMVKGETNALALVNQRVFEKPASNTIRTTYRALGADVDLAEKITAMYNAAKIYIPEIGGEGVKARAERLDAGEALLKEAADTGKKLTPAQLLQAMGIDPALYESVLSAA